LVLLFLSEQLLFVISRSFHLATYGEGTGHVFNLGHGVTPGIDPEHVAAMVNAVTELSPAYH
jgi:uroporphyrinogen-III decarboxylase